MERPCGDDDEDDGPDGAGGGRLNHADGEDDGGSSDGLLDDVHILQRQRQQQSGVARQLCTTLLLSLDGTQIFGQGECSMEGGRGAEGECVTLPPSLDGRGVGHPSARVCDDAQPGGGLLTQGLIGG